MVIGIIIGLKIINITKIYFLEIFIYENIRKQYNVNKFKRF